MPSSTSDPLEAFNAWELEEKLRHVRRILDLPLGVVVPGTAIHHEHTIARVCWTATKLTAAALSCATVLVTWAMFHSRADLVGPAICAAGMAMAAWPVSRLTPQPSDCR